MATVSHIKSEDIKYLKFNEQGETSLINKKDHVKGYSYREVHDLKTKSQIKSDEGDAFVDN